MHKKIRIKFINMWDSFNIYDNLFTNILKEYYGENNVEVLDYYDDYSQNIDILFYSSLNDYALNYLYLFYSGAPQREIRTKLVNFSGENNYPNYNECDYAIGSHVHFSCGAENDKRYFRLPWWVYHLYHNKQLFHECFNKSINDELYDNRKFCSYVVANNLNADPIKQKIFYYINDNYVKVDSGGPVVNNIGKVIGKELKDKIDFCSQYRFNLSCENSNVDGYVTEKILDAFACQSVPIYWGNEYVKEDFNEDSFINVNDYIKHFDDERGFKDLIERIKFVDHHKDVYMNMLNAPKFKRTYASYIYDLTQYLIFIVEEGKVHNHLYGNVGLRLKSEMKQKIFNMAMGVYARKNN